MSWANSLEDAKKAATTRSTAFAIYFVEPTLNEFVGEGPESLAKYKKANKGKGLPQNIWDNNTTVDTMKKAGINTFVKVTVDKANAEICKKYSAEPNSLLLCAPNGDKIAMFAGERCSQSNVTLAMKTFRADFAAYLKNKATQDAKVAKAPETAPKK